MEDGKGAMETLEVKRMIKIFKGAFSGKKVLVTGHTGFKGTWLSIWLKMLGADVIGYALPPDTSPSIFHATGITRHITHIEADIRDKQAIYKVIRQYEPEVVFHLAAQPLVRASYEVPDYTFETNIMGTVNLLESLRRSECVKACVVITSDKCYENKEWEFAYRENDPLGGYDPYSASKACAELVVGAYRNSFFGGQNGTSHSMGLASVRAGNVIGGGDWAPDRIVPDAVKSLATGCPIQVRNPRAVRPWQHVLEPLSGYLWLAVLLMKNRSDLCSAWNFGPNSSDALTVGQLTDLIVGEWGTGTWQDVSGSGGIAPHEANYLKLDCTRARTIIEWEPVFRLNDAVEATIKWYKNYYTDPKSAILEFTVSQIVEYVQRAREVGVKWADEVELHD